MVLFLADFPSVVKQEKLNFQAQIVILIFWEEWALTVLKHEVKKSGLLNLKGFAWKVQRRLGNWDFMFNERFFGYVLTFSKFLLLPQMLRDSLKSDGSSWAIGNTFRLGLDFILDSSRGKWHFIQVDPSFMPTKICKFHRRLEDSARTKGH